MRLSRLLTMVALTALGSIGLGAGAHAQTYSPKLFSQMRWRPIGPLRGGRGRAVAGVPGEPSVFYIGNDDGGVWKSTDYGNSWHPIFDQEPTSSIGAIAVSVSDPNVIYVGTGESNIRPDQATGMGMYKSTDAGKTWRFMGLRQSEDIAMIAVDPHDPNRVFVAALGHVSASAANIRSRCAWTSGSSAWIGSGPGGAIRRTPFAVSTSTRRTTPSGSRAASRAQPCSSSAACARSCGTRLLARSHISSLRRSIGCGPEMSRATSPQWQITRS